MLGITAKQPLPSVWRPARNSWAAGQYPSVCQHLLSCFDDKVAGCRVLPLCNKAMAPVCVAKSGPRMQNLQVNQGLISFAGSVVESIDSHQHTDPWPVTIENSSHTRNLTPVMAA